MLVFGYGALINCLFVKEKFPSAVRFSPVRLFGFKRILDYPSPEKMTSGGRPTAAFNLLKTDKKEDFLNGIMFEVNSKDFNLMCEQEKGYEVVFVDVVLESGRNQGSIKTFVAKNYNQVSFNRNDREQENYLKLCFEGCKEIDSKFLEEFKQTSFVSGRSLKEMGY